jgi:hypothetical protein
MIFIDKVQLTREYIERNAETPFEWGVFDCGLFVLGYLKEVQGIDLIEKYNLSYSTELGSKRAVKKYGFDTLEELVDSEFDRVDRPKRGDLACYDGALGICIDQVCVFLNIDSNYVLIPNGQVNQFWGVQCHKQSQQ